MFLGMTCSCGASLEADAYENDTLIMLWANSFISAHQACGYMSQFKEPNAKENTVRYDVMPKERHEKEL
jgi:hypothetical protein